MKASTISPLTAAARGVGAGAVGTVAMDLLWYARYRRDGGGDRFLDWEFSAGTTGFDGAGVPAQVGRRVARGLLHVELPDTAAGATNNVVHGATGAQWGALYGVAAGTAGAPMAVAGVALGAAAWVTSYALLGALKVYKPIWQYDTDTLAKDLSAHLVFGVMSAAAYRVLRPR